MLTRILVVVGAVAGVADCAYSEVTFTAGQVSTTFSWRGGDINPAGYEDPNTVWSATASTNYSGNYGHAGAYLGHGHGTMQASLNGGVRAESYIESGWGFYDVRTRDFTLESTHVQYLTLSQDYVFTRDLTHTGFTGPFDSATLLNTDLGGAPIDLLTTTSGVLPAGNYRWQTSLSAEWSTDQRAITHNGSTMEIYFQLVPAPGGAAMLILGSALACRRRRTTM